MPDGAGVAVALIAVVMVLDLLGEPDMDALAWTVVQFVLLLIVVVAFGVAFLVWTSGR